MSIATKVLVQMTTKLGGAPWTVKIPFKVPIMVVGFDTYHDEAHRGHSVGALVASLNNSLTRCVSSALMKDQRLTHLISRYFSVAQPHVPKEEISNCIPTMMTVALRNFYEKNKVLPKKIFFYR
jgi:aubergine-like protein